MQTILAIDDEESVRQSYRVILAPDYEVLLAEGGAAGLKLIEEKHVDLVLLDLTMPGMTGEEVLTELHNRGETTPVVVVTASNSVNVAVEAMKLGAREYVIKPFDVDVILMNIRRILDEEREKRELNALREADLKGFESLVGSSPAFMDTLAKAKQAMQVDSTVLITGESGTGKDLLARGIHFGGRRVDKAFVPLSCCTIPAPLVESELFGHEKGSFTGADKRHTGKLQVADGGTIFLDEIGEMPMEAQAKLLRVLQDSCFYPVGSTKEIRVDIRVISATNRDLPETIKEGNFREDLYYRLNVLHIEMPSLRQRREDIPDLVTHFAAKHGPRVNAKTREIAPTAMVKLTAYAWPGNIRELENTVERMLVHYGQEEVISASQVASLLPQHPGDGPALGGQPGDEPLSLFDGLTLEDATSRVERYLIENALARNNNVQSRAAEALGTTRRVIKYKIDQFGIESE